MKLTSQALLTTCSLFALAISVPATRTITEYRSVAGSATADPMPVGSIWHGTQSQEGRKGEQAIVLYVSSRLDDTFDATMWWPSLNNGVVKAAGRLGEKSEITLDFGDVIFGHGTQQKVGLVGGAKTKGKLEKDRFVCEGKVKANEGEDPVAVTYRLRRAN